MHTSTIERLESRIAPATIINHKTLIFSDEDGDDVTVHFSKPILTPATLASGFIFSSSPSRPDGSIPQSLVCICLLGMKVGKAAQGIDISVTATQSPVHGGNGRVDVGSIAASAIANDGIPANPNNVDLGTIQVQGDLGLLFVGDENYSTPALQLLDVGSMGIKHGGYGEFVGGVGKIIGS